MNAVCEVSYKQAGMTPEVSFGSHFFQDVVESGIFYAAVYDGAEGVTLHLEQLLAGTNLLPSLTEDVNELVSVVHVTQLPGLTLYSSIRSQQLLCFLE